MNAINLRDHEVRALLGKGRVLLIRPVKLTEFRECTNVPGSDWYFRSKHYGIWSDVSTARLIEKYSPFGAPGSDWWGRETWTRKRDDNGMLVYTPDGNEDQSCVWYSASNPNVMACDEDGGYKFNKDGSEASPWISSVIMPRWASRLSGVVGNTRVMRVQDVDEFDAIEAGMYCDNLADLKTLDHPRKEVFKIFWNDTYPMPYEDSPWVWLTEIERKA